jgi:two-component system sensor histidine kinase/response regulator
MQSDRDRCIAAGMNDHVAKPIEPEDLWNTLLKWIKPKQSKMSAAPTPDKQQDIRLPIDIDGLDISNGLRRVLGKKPLYLSMLNKFVAGEKFATANIFRELENNDWDAAMRLTHTLKGVSGNIGAAGLQHLAEKLEQAIKERNPREQVNGLLDLLVEPLENLILQLEHQLPVKTDTPPITIQLEKLQMVCLRLEALLADDNAEATDVWEENANLFNASYPLHFGKIDDCMRSFNFEAALVILKTAAETERVREA